MNSERAEYYLRVYSFMNERDRKIMANEIASVTPGELLATERLESKGLKAFEVYSALSKLSDTYKGDFKLVWQNICPDCKSRIGDMYDKVYELPAEEYCNKCNANKQAERKLMYKILS